MSSKFGSVEGSGHNVSTVQAEVGVRNVAEEHTPGRVSLVLCIRMVDHVRDEFLQGQLVKQLPKIPVVEGVGGGDNLGDDALAILDGDRGGVLLQSSHLELLQGSPEAEDFKGRCECLSVVQHNEEELSLRPFDLLCL